MALLHITPDSEKKSHKFDPEAEASLIEALTTPKRMHTASTEKIFSHLLTYFKFTKNEKSYGQVSAVASAYGFCATSLTAKAQSAPNKRVVFCVDYSGSMAGSKIKAAVENINNMFEKHIQIGDTVMLMHFSNSVYVDFELTVKQEASNQYMLSQINALTGPNGGTAFYDSLHEASSRLKNSSGSSDWIVALTDGEDNASSKTSLSDLKSFFKSSSIGLIVIGVGMEVEIAKLITQLTDSSPKGVYVSAAGDKKSIDMAFEQVIEFISQGDVVLEDI